MKKLLKSEVCESCEQCMGLTGVHCSHPKLNNPGFKKKKVENVDMNVGKHKMCFPNAHFIEDPLMSYGLACP